MNAAKVTETAVGCLEDLGPEFSKHGWNTRLEIAVGRIPSLFVQNPDPTASALSERIFAAPRDEEWWYWWSWAEPIAATPAAATTIIRSVLRSVSAR